MAFSNYLNSKRDEIKELIRLLSKHFSYVSCLATDVKITQFMANKKNCAVKEGGGECGFVFKLHNGNSFFEYSLSDISEDKNLIVQRIIKELKVQENFADKCIKCNIPLDEKLVKSFCRESDFENYSDNEVLSFCCLRSSCRSDQHIK